MIAPTQMIPSDVVLSQADHALAVTACRWAKIHAELALNGGADAGARGSLAAIIADMETVLRALGASDD